MKVSAGLAGGLAGTVAVASMHEALRRVTPDAPRMDILDMDLIRKGLKSIIKKGPGRNKFNGGLEEVNFFVIPPIIALQESEEKKAYGYVGLY